MNPFLWWQRRKARKADDELLEFLALKEWFLGPMDENGRRPVDASQIRADMINAYDIRVP